MESMASVPEPQNSETAVPDLELRLYEIAVEALGTQRDAYRRYLAIVDAQRAALRANNLSLVSSLAERLDGTVAEIQDCGKLMAPVHQALGTSSVDGPRTQALKDLMTATAAEAVLAQSSVRELTKRLVGQRDDVSRQLTLEHGTSPGAGTGRGARSTGPALIDTRG